MYLLMRNPHPPAQETSHTQLLTVSPCPEPQGSAHVDSSLQDALPRPLCPAHPLVLPESAEASSSRKPFLLSLCRLGWMFPSFE